MVNLFLIAYTIAFVASGRLTDWLGARLGMTLYIAWWSVANKLTTFAHSFASLGLFRFCLGLGEAGNWTAAPKVVAEWFTARERALAIGLYTLGATLGATIAPLMITLIALHWGWRGAFAARPKAARRRKPRPPGAHFGLFGTEPRPGRAHPRW